MQTISWHSTLLSYLSHCTWLPIERSLLIPLQVHKLNILTWFCFSSCFLRPGVNESVVKIHFYFPDPVVTTIEQIPVYSLEGLLGEWRNVCHVVVSILWLIISEMCAPSPLMGVIRAEMVSSVSHHQLWYPLMSVPCGWARSPTINVCHQFSEGWLSRIQISSRAHCCFSACGIRLHVCLPCRDLTLIAGSR